MLTPRSGNVVSRIGGVSSTASVGFRNGGSLVRVINRRMSDICLGGIGAVSVSPRIVGHRGSLGVICAPVRNANVVLVPHTLGR